MRRGKGPETRLPATADKARADSEQAMLERVGAIVRRRREARGLTRRALANASGVSERYLSQLEGGLANPTVVLLSRLAVALGEPLPSFLPGRVAAPDPVGADDLVRAWSRLPDADRDRVRRALDEAAEAPRPARIALVGLDGAGKTTLGGALARHLAVPFVELARELGEMGAAPADYAARERALLAALPERHPVGVLEVPSHLALRPGNFSLLLEHCHTIWLRADPAEIARRLAARSGTGAGAAPAGVDYVRALLAKRTALFAKAHRTLDTSGLPAEDAVARLCRLVS
jgi:XRE family transcriptional regulator, aerobic/anaerobic benzoate catabolism transcriptional regulator